MFKYQKNKIAMAKSVEAVLGDNEEIVNSVPEFQELYMNLKSKCEDIEFLDIKRMNIRNGMFVNKEKLKANTVSLALGIAGAVYAYARKNKDHELAEKSNIYRSELEMMRDNELAANFRYIGELANGLKQELVPFGLNEQKLTDYFDSVESFVKAVSDSVSSFAVKRGDLQTLKTAFAELDEILVSLDKMLNGFIVENHGFLNRYKSARRIKKFGIRHNKENEPDTNQTAVHPSTG